MTSTDPGSKSSSEIERELEEDRARIRRTGRELQDRMSVGALVDEMVNRGREHGGDWAAGLGRTIRDNPIPVTVIGVCLAWMLAGGQRASERREEHHGGDGRELGLGEEGGYPRPATRPGVAAAPYAPPPPVGLTGQRTAGAGPAPGGPAAGPATASSPGAGSPGRPSGAAGETPPRPAPGTGTSPGGVPGYSGPAAGDDRPTTPPPAARPMEGPGPGPRGGDEKTRP